MRKRVWGIALAIIGVCTLSAGLFGCGDGNGGDNGGGGGHTHTYSTEWSHDETFHWHAATCEHTNEISDKAEHTFVNEICSVCGYEKEADTPVEPENPSEDGLEYTLNSNNTYSVTGIGTCTDTKINIPSEYNGKKVTSIGSYAFVYQTELEKISIPDSIKSIGSYAFAFCLSLKDVELPATLTSIGTGAFAYCLSLTEIAIPEQVTSLGSAAFAECIALRSITFADNCKINTIQSNTFYGCTSLRSIIIPQSVRSIYSDAFEGCIHLVEIYNLSELSLSKGSTSNGSVALYALNIFDSLAEESRLMQTQDGFLTYIDSANDQYVLVGYVGDKSVITLPNDIGGHDYTINRGAFMDQYQLISVTVPAAVTKIGDEAFWGCYKLIEVRNFSNLEISLSDSYKVNGGIARYAKNIYTDQTDNSCLSQTYEGFIVYADDAKGDYFLMGYAGDAKNIILPEDINGHDYSVYECAFYGRTDIDSIEISSGVTSLNFNVFQFCDAEIKWQNDIRLNALAGAFCAYMGTSLTVPDNVSLGSEEFLNCFRLQSVDLPVNMTILPSGLFADCASLKNIEIPQSVTAIEQYVFRECMSLTEVVIPAAVETIGAQAFSTCTNLKKITFDENSNLINIGEQAFYGCETLKTIAIPSNVTDIGSQCFYNCTNLKTISFADNSSLKTVGSQAFAKSGITEISLPDGVTSIGERAFQECLSLENVKIGKCLAKIDSYMFSACNSLVTIEIPDTVKEIGEYAFAGCAFTELVLPKSLKSIGRGAMLSLLYLTEITIPESVETIAEGAFAGEALLNKTIYCEASEKPAGWDDNWNIIDDGIYIPVVWNCRENQTANDGAIYTVVKDIRYAIKDGEATVMQSSWHVGGKVTIPSSISYGGNTYPVTVIGYAAFVSYMSTLTAVELPDTITSIGDYAFSWCDSLTEITIPDSVESIGVAAFRSCNALTIYCEVAEKPSGWNNEWNEYNCPVVWDCNNSKVADDGCIYAFIDGIRYSLKDGEAVVAGQTKSISGAIVIPETVTYGNSVYTVTSIAERAFYSCDFLNSISIPAGVTSIGSSAFAYCDSLTDITYGGTIEQWNAVQKGSSWDIYYTIRCTDGDITKD